MDECLRLTEILDEIIGFSLCSPGMGYKLTLTSRELYESAVDVI